MRPIEKRVLAITILGHALCHIYNLILPGALRPIADSFMISLTTLTGIGTISYFLFGFGAFPAGVLAGKTNANFTLKIYFLFSALSALFIGLSGSLNMFAVGLSFLGLFGSLYHVAGLTLIAQCIEKKGKAMGIHGMAGSLGEMSAPLISSVVVVVSGWREVYLWMVIPGLIGFLFLVIDKKIPAADVTSTESKKNHQKPGKSNLVFFSIALIAMGLNGFVYRGFMTMLPTYITEKVSLGSFSGILAGGIFSTIILSVGIAGQYLGGHFSDRMSQAKLYRLIFLCSMPFIVLMGFTQNFWLVLCALLFSFFHFSVQPVENHLISILMPPRLVSYGYGIKYVFTFGIGSFATGFAGYIADHFSMATLFPVLGGIICISVVVTSILVRLERRKSQPAIN